MVLECIYNGPGFVELRPKYFERIRSVQRLLIPWLLMSPGHKQPWYYLCRISMPLSSMRKDFNFQHHIIARSIYEMKCKLHICWNSAQLIHIAMLAILGPKKAIWQPISSLWSVGTQLKQPPETDWPCNQDNIYFTGNGITHCPLGGCNSF